MWPVPRLSRDTAMAKILVGSLSAIPEKVLQEVSENASWLDNQAAADFMQISSGQRADFLEVCCAAESPLTGGR